MISDITRDVIVLGLGNPLMSDEGIGGFLVERFLSRQQDYPQVEFLDAGTAGMSILHLIANRKKVVFIDCAFMGAEPGSIKKFSPEDVKSVKKLAHQSLHEADLLKIIEISRKLGSSPEKIVIFGIEPSEIKLNMGLSKTLTARMDDYIAAISDELLDESK